jgi:hypothetical protein
VQEGLQSNSSVAIRRHLGFSVLDKACQREGIQRVKYQMMLSFSLQLSCSAVLRPTVEVLSPYLDRCLKRRAAKKASTPCLKAVIGYGCAPVTNRPRPEAGRLQVVRAEECEHENRGLQASQHRSAVLTKCSKMQDITALSRYAEYASTRQDTTASFRRAEDASTRRDITASFWQGAPGYRITSEGRRCKHEARHHCIVLAGRPGLSY